MRELTADLFVSLDGFAAGVDVGPYFGYFGPELADWVRTELDRPQVIVMGRVTYQALSPMAATADEASARTNDLPKVVYSNTLQEPLTWSNTQATPACCGAISPRRSARSSGSPATRSVPWAASPW
jgi:dihydrofolate reductase